jgi:hypothetical protein
MDRTVIDFDASLGEQFHDAAVCRAALAFVGDEFSEGFEFGGCVHDRKTYSNKLKQVSNTFERCWSLSEAGDSERKHCLGKMSVPIFCFWRKLKSSFFGAAVGTFWTVIAGTYRKGGSDCFG